MIFQSKTGITKNPDHKSRFYVCNETMKALFFVFFICRLSGCTNRCMQAVTHHGDPPATHHGDPYATYHGDSYVTSRSDTHMT